MVQCQPIFSISYFQFWSDVFGIFEMVGLNRLLTVLLCAICRSCFSKKKKERFCFAFLPLYEWKMSNAMHYLIFGYQMVSLLCSGVRTEVFFCLSVVIVEIHFEFTGMYFILSSVLTPCRGTILSLVQISPYRAWFQRITWTLLPNFVCRHVTRFFRTFGCFPCLTSSSSKWGNPNLFEGWDTYEQYINSK